MRSRELIEGLDVGFEKVHGTTCQRVVDAAETEGDGFLAGLR
jgi:hypothetical protein